MAEEASSSSEKQPEYIDSEKNGELVRVRSCYDENGPVEFEEKAELRLVWLCDHVAIADPMPSASEGEAFTNDIFK